MRDFESLRIDQHPIDDELCDAGTLGPEFAHLARAYCASPRALVFRDPSPDWRLFALLLPLGSRLSLMTNPIFAQLTRSWGLNVRFVGIDRDGLVHDFRALLTDRTLSLLVDWLAGLEQRRAGGEEAGDAGLDLLFAALAGEMLTILENSEHVGTRHLELRHRLESDVPGTLFERATRFPDFIHALRRALRDGSIDVEFYSRVLRSIDLREAAFEERMARIIEGALDPVTLAMLERCGTGQHLGCYNWLRIAPRHAPARAHVLASLPALAGFFADALLTCEHPRTYAGTQGEGRLAAEMPDHADFAAERGFDNEQSRRAPGRNAGFDLPRLVAGRDTAHGQHWARVLRQAVDAGQDRMVIEAIAERFAVEPNVIRRLWHERPSGIGQPPSWQIAPILHVLAGTDWSQWPASERQWEELLAAAVPAEAA